MNKGLLVVIAGPSGVGKGTIYNQVLEARPNFRKSISVTTRPPRPAEQEGVHYYFRTLEQYQQMIASGEFLETAEVYSNYYGTPKKPIFDMLDQGSDVLFEVDVHGARQIRQKYAESVLIYIFAPTFADLEARLRGRGTETEDSINRRLSSSHNELREASKFFDYIVYNADVDSAVEEILSIVDAERHKVKRNLDDIDKLLKTHKKKRS